MQNRPFKKSAPAKNVKNTKNGCENSNVQPAMLEAFGGVIDKLATIKFEGYKFISKKAIYNDHFQKLQKAKKLKTFIQTLQSLVGADLFPNPVITNLVINKMIVLDVARAFRYYEVVVSKFHSVKAHTSMILAAGKIGRIDLVEIAYANATNPRKYVADPWIHNTMIDVVGKYGRMDLAIMAYRKATDPARYQANAVTYTSMINVASRNDEMDLAIMAYAKATDPQKYEADTFTHASMIDAAGIYKRMDLAIIAYTKATDPKRYAADIVTHFNMINAASKNGRIDLAKDAFEKATDPRKYEANNVTYGSMMDCYMLNNHIEEAKKIYKNSNIKLKVRTLSKNNYWIDLHGYSAASVYFTLNEFIENTQKPFTLTLIYGKGSHSHCVDNDSHPIKKSAHQLLEALKHKYSISLKENPKNIGEVFCTIENRLDLKVPVKLAAPTIASDIKLPENSIVEQPKTSPSSVPSIEGKHNSEENQNDPIDLPSAIADQTGPTAQEEATLQFAEINNPPNTASTSWCGFFTKGAVVVAAGGIGLGLVLSQL